MVPSRPILGLIVAPDPPPALVRLLFEMRLWCTTRAVEPDLPASAWLATSPAAPGIEVAKRSGRPFALWVDDPDAVPRAEALGPDLTLTSDSAVSERTAATLVPGDPNAPADRIAVIPPFVRERLRRRAGLPSLLVADLTTETVPEALVPAALAACSACIVTGARLWQALAWGAPTVTDDDSAASAGASHDREVLIGTPRDRVRLAEALGRDPLRAARLSRAARRLAEARSVKRVAAQVAERLDLIRAGAAPVRPRVEAVLRLLAVPSSPLEPDLPRLLAVLEEPAAARAGAR